MKNLQTLSKVALSFIGSENFDKQMNDALEIVGKHVKVSRVYIFIDSEDGNYTSNKYEWCGEGISPQIDELQNIPYEAIASWKEILQKDGRIYSEDISEFPKDIYEMLSPQNILSIIVYPIMFRNQLSGFVGFDECFVHRKWTEEELELLRAISGILSTAYEKKISEEIRKVSEKNFEVFFETIEDAFVIANISGEIVHYNRALPILLGYTENELNNTSITKIYDYQNGDSVLTPLLRASENKNEVLILPLKSKNNQIIPVETRLWKGKWNNRDSLFIIVKNLSKERALLRKFTSLFESNPELMAISEIESGCFIDVNEAFLKKLGYEENEILGKTPSEISLFVDKNEIDYASTQLLENGRIKGVEMRIRAKNGTLLTCLYSGEIIEHEEVGAFLSVITDITERALLTKKVEEQRKRLENIIDGTRLGTWEWNVQTGETVFNERWANIIGYTLEEIMPTTIETWMKHAHEGDLKESEALLTNHFEGKSKYYEFECRMKHKSGNWVWVLDRGKVIEWDKEGKPLKMFGTHAEITEKKKMQEIIRENSIRDALTNLYNRRYIFERLQTELSEFKRGDKNFAIAILDIDHFKKINDTYGHLAGDFILRELSSKLASGIRDYDLVGRYGGEEFIIVLQNENRESAFHKIESILVEIRDTAFVYDSQTIFITFSAGITDSEEFDKKADIESFIERADNRLYKAKNSGRNRVVSN